MSNQRLESFLAIDLISILVLLIYQQMSFQVYHLNLYNANIQIVLNKGTGSWLTLVRGFSYSSGRKI